MIETQEKEKKNNHSLIGLTSKSLLFVALVVAGFHIIGRKDEKNQISYYKVDPKTGKEKLIQYVEDPITKRRLNLLAPFNLQTKESLEKLKEENNQNPNKEDRNDLNIIINQDVLDTFEKDPEKYQEWLHSNAQEIEEEKYLTHEQQILFWKKQLDEYNAKEREREKKEFLLNNQTSQLNKQNTNEVLYNKENELNDEKNEDNQQQENDLAIEIEKEKTQRKNAENQGKEYYIINKFKKKEILTDQEITILENIFNQGFFENDNIEQMKNFGIQKIIKSNNNHIKAKEMFDLFRTGQADFRNADFYFMLENLPENSEEYRGIKKRLEHKA